MADDIRASDLTTPRHFGNLVDREDDVQRSIAFHWLGVYSWLIACEKNDLRKANAASASAPSRATRDAMMIDVEMLGRRAHRYEERLRYWQRRVTVNGHLPETTQTHGAF